MKTQSKSIIHLICFLFFSILFSTTLSAKIPKLPIILEDGWKRGPADIEEKQNIWYMGKHKKWNDKTSPFIKCIVPCSTDKTSDYSEAKKILNELIKSISEKENPEISKRGNKEWMTLTYSEKDNDKNGDITRHMIAMWDGLNIRTVFFIIPGELGDKLPYSCYKMMTKWLNPGTPPNLQNTLESATNFQQSVQEDFAELLKSYIVKEAYERLESFNELLIYSQPVKGWKTLISDAIITPVGTAGRKRLISFYHPYSDIVIFTSWLKHTKTQNIMMDDAVIIDGFYLRNGDKKISPSAPTWLSQKKNHPILNLAPIISKTLKKAQAKGAVIFQYTPVSKRTNKNRRIICSSYFLSHLYNISDFYSDEIIKTKTFNFLIDLYKKEPKLFYNKKDLENDSAMRGLYSLSAGFIETLSPKAYFKTQNTNTLLLSSPRSTGSIILLSFDNNDNPLPIQKGIINLQDLLNQANKNV